MLAKAVSEFRQKEVFAMLWFSSNPWHAPMPSSVTYGQCFPVVVGPVGSKEETDAVARENGDKVTYIPVYMGWM
jgi:hypothetical protein